MEQKNYVTSCTYQIWLRINLLNFYREKQAKLYSHNLLGCLHFNMGITHELRHSVLNPWTDGRLSSLVIIALRGNSPCMEGRGPRGLLLDEIYDRFI